MASDMEKYLDMSLDEYIAAKKGGVRNIGNKTAIAASCTSNNSGSTFKAERRNSKTNDKVDEDEIMDNDLDPQGDRPLGSSSDKLNKSTGIWRGPSAETNYIDLDYMRDEFDEMFNDPELQKSSEDQFAKQQQNVPRDLRDRLNNSSLNTNNSNKNYCINVRKQQAQSVYSENKQNNVNANRCANMHAQQQSMSLTSLNTDGLNTNVQHRRRWNNNRNFRRRNNAGGGNRGGGFINNSSQSLNWNNRNGAGSCVGVNNTNMLPMNNNGRIQRVNQHRYNQDVLNKNIKSVLEQINSTNSIYANRPAGPVRDLTIECPSVLIPGRLTAGTLQTAATQQTLPAQSTHTQSDLKALLGVNESNLKAETMAMWAGKLLDLFQSGQQQTVHKPIYDMQIQKEIHELQGKSLLYKCPSGEVVSSDGTGIDNCKITPNSSGVTLNYRFG